MSTSVTSCSYSEGMEVTAEKKTGWFINKSFLSPCQLQLECSYFQRIQDVSEQGWKTKLMVIPRSGKDLQLESTRKGENIAFTPVMPPTPLASIYQQKSVAFILQIRKNTNCKQEPQVEMSISVCPSDLLLFAWFFSNNFSNKAHGNLWCVTEQELRHAAAFPGKQFN